MTRRGDDDEQYSGRVREGEKERRNRAGEEYRSTVLLILSQYLYLVAEQKRE